MTDLVAAAMEAERRMSALDERIAALEQRLRELQPSTDEPIEPQMSLRKFSKAFGIPYQTLTQKFVTDSTFPAFKLGGRWYVDTAKFRKWRDKTARRYA